MFSDPRKVAVAFAGIATFLNLYGPQAVLPLLAGEFGVGAAEASMIMMASTLSLALTAPFTGAISDVLGRKRVITIALVVLLIPTVMVGLSHNLNGIIFWRFMQGLVLPPIFVVTIAYVGDEFPPAEATAVTGIYISATTFGGFSGRFLTGILADTVGWRNAFLTDAVLTAILAAAIIWFLPKERKFVRQRNLQTSLIQMIRHLRNPKLLATYGVGFGVLFNFIATFTYINFRLAAPPYNLPASLLGAIFIVWVVGIALAPLTGRLVARFGRQRFMQVVAGTWVFGALLLLSPSLWVMLIGLVIVPAMGFFAQAMATSYVATTAKDGVSSAVGLYVGFFYLGGSMGAVLPGLLWDSYGWPSTIAMVIASVIVMGLLGVTAWKPASPQ